MVRQIMDSWTKDQILEFTQQLESTVPNLAGEVQPVLGIGSAVSDGGKSWYQPVSHFCYQDKRSINILIYRAIGLEDDIMAVDSDHVRQQEAVAQQDQHVEGTPHGRGMRYESQL